MFIMNNGKQFDVNDLIEQDKSGSSITNSDITIAIRVMSGWTCDGEVMRVDTNYDGKITNRDIIALIRKLAE